MLTKHKYINAAGSGIYSAIARKFRAILTGVQVFLVTCCFFRSKYGLFHMLLTESSASNEMDLFVSIAQLR